MTITATSPTSNTTSSSSTTSATATATSGALQGTSNEFLKLFMAQLQNQDPIDPQNSTDMVAQLAQFSSVEQQTQTNTNLQTLIGAQSGTTNASLSNLIGRQCNANVGNIKLDNTTTIPPIETSSSGAMTGASISVTNSDGKVVRTLPIPAGGGGVQWDGKDDSGNTVPTGNYALSVNTGTTTTAISATWQGTVSSIQLGASGSALQMGGIEVQPSDITTIGATSTATTAAMAMAPKSVTPATIASTTTAATTAKTLAAIQGAHS